MNVTKLEIKYSLDGLDFIFILKRFSKIYVYIDTKFAEKLKNEKYLYFFYQIKKRRMKRKG
tara:strand:- start:1008 stop:1190 length:183 start_codon:yes stop_codon:yes gene_type:complete